MNSIKKELLNLLKVAVDRDVNANNEVSSECFALLYQPSRKKAKMQNKNAKWL